MIAAQIPGWRDACDDVIDEVIDELEIENPPVDAFDVARRMGVEIVYDKRQINRARFKRLGGSPTIFLRPDERAERLQWAVAHELGEQMTHRVFAKLHHEGPVGGAMREQAANELAGRLLLPRRWFFEAVEQFDGDVLALKNRFETASHELILLGLLRWPDWSVVTVFDNQQVTRRFGNQGSAPRMTPVEHEVWDECHRTGRTVEREEAGVRVQAWAVHEGDWRRELMRVTAYEDCQEVQRELFELAS